MATAPVGMDDRLYTAKSPKEVVRLLALDPPIDVNVTMTGGDTPLHDYIRRGQDTYDLLLALLSHCEPNRIDIDSVTQYFNTPLHLAAEVNNIEGAKALIAFGADIDALNFYSKTPLDIARDQNHDEMLDLLFFVGSELGSQVQERLQRYIHLPAAPLNQCIMTPDEEKDIDWRGLSLSTSLRDRSLSTTIEDSFSQWQEWKRRKQLLRETKVRRKRRYEDPPVFKSKTGQRVLCLDGGGIRGLIQVEVLSYISDSTERTIPELFDFIVATSTGAIVALGLVYAELNISEIRKLYFEIKERVFGTARFGFGCDTDALEDVLKRVFQDKTMTKLKNGPKLLISAVSKETDKLELCWFNNFLSDDLCNCPIWEVARATSAAPAFFKPMNNFIDGGVRASNPSESGLTVIQDYLRRQSERTDDYSQLCSKNCVSLVVSVGTGQFPAQLLGDLDVEKYLFPKKLILHPSKITPFKDMKNLLKMFLSAIDNSEDATKNTQSRCSEQKIAFYRFNPSFDKSISLKETDSKILCDMIINARVHIVSQLTHMDEIIQSFYHQK